MNPKIISLSPDNIEATTATQVRTKFHPEIIKQYEEDLANGAIFPPLVVFAEEGSQRFILADGFHRHRAYINAGSSEVRCELHEGRQWNALMYALGANAQHGLRRTNADKRKAVVMALKNPEISQLQVQEIADICRVTTRTVRRARDDLMLKENGYTRNDRTKSDSHEPNKEDFRVSRPAPTQEMVDRDELRTAMSLIKGLPYDGDQVEKLGLSPDDIADLNFCLDWLTKALEAYVAAQYQPDVRHESENREVNEQ